MVADFLRAISEGKFSGRTDRAQKIWSLNTNGNWQSCYSSVLLQMKNENTSDRHVFDNITRTHRTTLMSHHDAPSNKSTRTAKTSAKPDPVSSDRESGYPEFGSGWLPKFNTDFLSKDTSVIFKNHEHPISFSRDMSKVWKSALSIATLKNPSNNYQIRVRGGWLPKLSQFFIVHRYMSGKDLISSFYTKLLTDKQTDRQTDTRGVKHYLLGGGNNGIPCRYIGTEKDRGESPWCWSLEKSGTGMPWC